MDTSGQQAPCENFEIPTLGLTDRCSASELTGNTDGVLLRQHPTKHQVGRIRTCFPRFTGGCPCHLGRIPVTTILHRALKTFQYEWYIQWQILLLLKIQELMFSYISPIMHLEGLEPPRFPASS